MNHSTKEVLEAYEARTRADITVKHKGVEYSAQIGTIESTSLGYEDHGVLTAMVHVHWEGGGVGVGGFCLDVYSKEDDQRKVTAYGMDQVVQIMKVVGVRSWEKLVGQPVMALFEEKSSGLGAMSVGLASLEGTRAIVLKQHYEEWAEELKTAFQRSHK